jgi:gelsolin
MGSTRPALSIFLLVAAVVLISAAPATNKGKVINNALKNAGKTKGLEIWRIVNFEPVAVAKNDYGKFFTGDSYIVLNVK